MGRAVRGARTPPAVVSTGEAVRSFPCQQAARTMHRPARAGEAGQFATEAGGHMREKACMHEGTCYPTNHVIAAIDRRPEAEEAGAALRNAGFADVGLFHGQRAYVAIQDASRHATLFRRAWWRLRDLGGEGELHHQYLATLLRGGSYLIVRADTAEQASQARDILVTYHAHDIWRFGAWTSERLSERQAVAGEA